jgi:hypothetical protein
MKPTRLQVPCDQCESEGNIIDDTGELVTCPACQGAGWITVEEPPEGEEPFDIQTVEGYIHRMTVPIFESVEDGMAYAYVEGKLYLLQEPERIQPIMKLVNASVAFDGVMRTSPDPRDVKLSASLAAYQKAVDGYLVMLRERNDDATVESSDDSRGEVR